MKGCPALGLTHALELLLQPILVDIQPPLDTFPNVRVSAAASQVLGTRQREAVVARGVQDRQHGLVEFRAGEESQCVDKIGLHPILQWLDLGFDRGPLILCWQVVSEPAAQARWGSNTRA